MKTHIELIEQAAIELPVASQKTTVYVPRESAGYPWIATTNSEVLGRSQNQERDEARAKLIALALNHHEELVEALKACAEQVRLFMELHDDDEDAPLAYDKAQVVLTKLTKS